MPLATIDTTSTIFIVSLAAVGAIWFLTGYFLDK